MQRKSKKTHSFTHKYLHRTNTYFFLSCSHKERTCQQPLHCDLLRLHTHTHTLMCFHIHIPHLQVCTSIPCMCLITAHLLLHMLLSSTHAHTHTHTHTLARPIGGNEMHALDEMHGAPCGDHTPPHIHTYTRTHTPLHAHQFLQ